jgi:plastocyanin
MSIQKLPRRRLLASVGSATIIGIAGCSTQGNDTSSTTNPSSRTDEQDPKAESATSTSTPEETEGATTDKTVVDMITDNKGSYFDPKGLVIDPGTTIQFVNTSGSHAATAYHPDNDDKPLRIPEDATVWDSGIYTDTGETFEHTFGVEGVYDYYCSPHEMLGMVGRIIVGTPQDGPGTNPPEELPPAAQESLPSIESVLDQRVVNGP